MTSICSNPVGHFTEVVAALHCPEIRVVERKSASRVKIMRKNWTRGENYVGPTIILLLLNLLLRAR